MNCVTCSQRLQSKGKSQRRISRKDAVVEVKGKMWFLAFNMVSVKFGYIAEEFDKSKFLYDAETDTYICPEGNTLIFEAYLKHKNGYQGKSYRCTDYKNCPSRFKCSKAGRGRKLSRPHNEPAIVRQREKQFITENQEKLKRRKTIIEPVFGTIKRVMRFRRWTVRGLANVRAQWSIICTAHNLRKLHAVWAE